MYYVEYKQLRGRKEALTEANTEGRMVMVPVPEYAVGNEGVTVEEAKEHASREGLEMYQLFPLRYKPTGQHLFRRRNEDGNYVQGRSREFAARVSGYVGRLIEKDVAGE